MPAPPHEVRAHPERGVMSRFFIETLCIFFAFAAGYYKNMSLFTAVAAVFWVYCLTRGRREREPHGTVPGNRPGGGGACRHPDSD